MISRPENRKKRVSYDSHTLPVDDAVGYFRRHRQEPVIRYAQTKVIKCISKGSVPSFLLHVFSALYIYSAVYILSGQIKKK